MNALNTQGEKPREHKGDNAPQRGLVLPTVPSADIVAGSEQSGASTPSRSPADISKAPTKAKFGLKTRHQFLINLQMKEDGTVYIPKPNPHDPTTRVEQNLWAHLSKQADLATHWVVFDGQEVRLKVRGPETLTASLRARLADVSATGLRVRLTDSMIVLHDVRSSTGENIHLSSGASDEPALPSTLRQLIFERNRARKERLLDLQFSVLEALTPEEYEHTKPDLNYPESADAKLRSYDAAIAKVLTSHTRAYSQAELPTWLQDLHRAIKYTHTTIHSTHPHMDAVLLILDPQSKLFKEVAASAPFQQFIQECQDAGLLPRLFWERSA
jgi:hypothetical protein